MSGSGVAAVTWWGHSSTTVELGSATVATDPLLSRQLFHLRRSTPAPGPAATTADLVLVSHLHHDHLHVPSLDRFDPAVPVVVPKGAPAVVGGLRGRELVEVEPGDSLDLAGVHVEVLAAHHGTTRSAFERGQAPALGFRLDDGTMSCWYPGDTGVLAGDDGFAAVAPVDLALVPIGGWGPTLGDEHLDPDEAAAAVAAVGARWALAVHYGTFWPVALRRINPANHRHFFVTPPQRFRTAMSGVPDTEVLTPAFGERVALGGAG